MSLASADYERFLARVSREMAIDAGAIRGRARDQRTTFGRRIVAICLRGLHYSYPDIGEAMGRNHTSVMRMVHGCFDAQYGRQTYVPASLDAARAEAARLLASEQAEPAPPKVRGGAWAGEGPKDLDHHRWNAALEAYRLALPHQRKDVWIAKCQELFPWSWQAQAAAPPRVPA